MPVLKHPSVYGSIAPLRNICHVCKFRQYDGSCKVAFRYSTIEPILDCSEFKPKEK